MAICAAGGAPPSDVMFSPRGDEICTLSPVTNSRERDPFCDARRRAPTVRVCSHDAYRGALRALRGRAPPNRFTSISFSGPCAAWCPETGFRPPDFSFQFQAQSLCLSGEQLPTGFTFVGRPPGPRGSPWTRSPPSVQILHDRTGRRERRLRTRGSAPPNASCSAFQAIFSRKLNLPAFSR